MLTVTEARQRILSTFSPLGKELIKITTATGRVLGVDVQADGEYPPFDNSAVDGFALRAEDTTSASFRHLSVVADIPAGTSPEIFLQSGQSARIMTGAQMPLGANCVIPVEATNFQNTAAGAPPPATITYMRPMQSGENIRKAGTDMKKGDLVLTTGRILRPQDIGLLATLGIAEVQVYKKARIALLSSGNELLEAGKALEPGKIRDSNSYSLAAAIETAGAEVVRLGVARDEFNAVTKLLNLAVEAQVDMIVSSAGVSVGAFDFIKEAIETQGEMNFWKVNMRPGKPLAFGSYRTIPFVGLPGNPVSAFVGFEVFIRPVLDLLNGHMGASKQIVRARITEEIESDGRESYLRARLVWQGGILNATLTGHQGSGNLLSLVQADALLIIPAGVKCVPAGEEVDAILL